MNRPKLEQLMSKKNSYMNTKNILNEGWFKNLARLGAVLSGIKKASKKTDKELAKKLKSSKNVSSSIDSLNKSVKNLEKIYSKLYGKKVKLSKFDTSDFIRP